MFEFEIPLHFTHTWLGGNWGECSITGEEPCMAARSGIFGDVVQQEIFDIGVYDMRRAGMEIRKQEDMTRDWGL